jgi:4a-hydroxytetrahydrobiopterin dehydratase
MKMDTTCDIANRRCAPCEGGTAPLADDAAEALLKALEGWSLADGKIDKTYRFANHYETMSFVNAVAWISHREDHHPELTVGYADCRVRYSTHAINGLSENDFICAAKIDRLFTL